MPSEKDRLYVALYARGGEVKMPGREDKYHWAFIIGPKNETPHSQGQLSHVKDSLSFAGNPPTPQPVWQYEDREILMAPTARLLVRILVGKVKSKSRLESVFKNTPVRPETHGWNCVEWVKEALESAGQDDRALGTAVTDWQSVRDTAMWYVDCKHEAGRFGEHYDPNRAPTWDIIDGKELMR
ncbi:hypothetical protein TOPH_09113 [Tolypocladium ophioglossoides CBS 100239]|uniref:Uncharacterized protein n=1 Tax=Tolypocladium ophioglossoides (strain CBS 100239) TaxID=1163406 RepID=A0A0L0MWU9_TOLOC|nr:hypothetical protein TOPH_09113 [Tolypocladium ophioglossoides CBS 100239]